LMTTEPMTTWSRKNPFPGTLLVNRRLTTGSCSDKETRHYEVSLEGSGLTYEPGDSLGVFPTNCPELVDEIVRALRCTGDEPVSDGAGGTKPLREALLKCYVIQTPSRQFLTALVQRAGRAASLSHDLLQPGRRADLECYLKGLETIDFLLDHPSIGFTAEEFVTLLRKPLAPRLYSIASSLKAHPGRVHLTVATVRYETHGRQRKGVASTFLAERVPIGGTLPLFIHVAKNFRLPENGDTPVIMVGPGTGIAPFRAYLQERKAAGARGKNWLFFGERHAAANFSYRAELEELQAEGVLTRLDLAFSRDQEQKIYVQHRMLEKAGELWKWLEEGAHFYVCGDALRMAKDVDFALHRIIESQGGKTPAQAAEYVETLKQDRRYKRDVY
jgi:sulfite reductase (NADPH) flavoprotein alpha-component